MKPSKIVLLSKYHLIEIFGGILMGFSVNMMTTLILTKPEGLAISLKLSWIISILLLLSGLCLSTGRIYLGDEIEKIRLLSKYDSTKKSFEEMLTDPVRKKKIDMFISLIVVGMVLLIIIFIIGLGRYVIT